KKLNDTYNFNLNFKNQISSLFDKNISLFISHELCWYENLVIADYCYKKNIKVHLISHGSHSLTDNTSQDDFFVSARANGMLYSNFANLFIPQSKAALKYLKNKNIPNNKILLNKPIMWGVSKFLKKNYSTNKKEFVILHASTSKIMSGRNWIYENSFEYIKNINYLIKKIDKFNNVKLVIRLRENLELDYRLTKLLFAKSKNVIIKLNGSFYDDVLNSDLIISYSSTVIEEALYLRKPVALFGNDYYRHFNIPKNLPLYSLTRNNFDNVFTEIINSYKKSNFKNLNNDDYCFNLNQNDYFQFLERIYNV
ncbi:hypothetical protein OA492_03655, partial [Pelagibacteraceae bacterium]|nr:hypothetical protein [Pelagibacteraceae bacterium]